MALFNYECASCGEKVRKFFKTRPDRPPLCSQDGNIMVEVVQGSTSVMEVLDNGAMTRKVERFRDIEDLRHQHAKSVDPKDEHLV